MEIYFEDDSIYASLRNDAVFNTIMEKCVLADYDAFDPVRNQLNAILDVAHLAGLDSTWNLTHSNTTDELLRHALGNFDHFLFCASGALHLLRSEQSIQRLDPLLIEESYSNIFLYIETAVETLWTEPNCNATEANKERLKGELAHLLAHFLDNQLTYDSLAFGDFENLVVKIYQSEWMMGGHWDGLVDLVEELLNKLQFDGVESLPIKMAKSDDVGAYFSIFWNEDDKTVENLEPKLKNFGAVPDNAKKSKSLLGIFSLLSSLQVSHDIFHYDVSRIQKLLPPVLRAMGHLCCYLVFDDDAEKNFHELLEAILDDILDYFFICRKSIFQQKRIDPALEVDEDSQGLIESLFALLLLLVEVDRSLYYFIIPTLANHFPLSKNKTWQIQFNYTLGRLPEDFPFYEEEEYDNEDQDDAKDDYLYVVYSPIIIA
jgi:hypothetical protein